MERYILKSEYVDYDAHELAVHLANLLCEKHAADATILVPAKKHFKNVTLKKVFTEGAMRKLNAKHVAATVWAIDTCRVSAYIPPFCRDRGRSRYVRRRKRFESS